MAVDRIDMDDAGVDDVAINGVDMFRMERMRDGCFWICLYRAGKPDQVFWLNAKGKISASHEEN